MEKTVNKETAAPIMDRNRFLFEPDMIGKNSDWI